MLGDNKSTVAQAELTAAFDFRVLLKLDALFAALHNCTPKRIEHAGASTNRMKVGTERTNHGGQTTRCKTLDSQLPRHCIGPLDIF